MPYTAAAEAITEDSSKNRAADSSQEHLTRLPLTLLSSL